MSIALTINPQVSALFALGSATEGGEAEEVGGGDGGRRRLRAVVILLLAEQDRGVALWHREVAAYGVDIRALSSAQYAKFTACASLECRTKAWPSSTDK